VQIVVFLVVLCIEMGLAMGVCAANSVSQSVSATLGGGIEEEGSSGSNGGFSGGAIVGITAGGGAVAGASALAFAPLLLAGLSPNSVIYAAAPIGAILYPESFLKSAVIQHFDIKNYSEAFVKIQSNGDFYFAQNNSEIINGSFDIQTLTLPKELQSAKKIKINITIASQPYKEVSGEPELSLGIYKNITKPNLSKKFETQQFLHNYLMKKYEIPLNIISKNYDSGIQTLSGVIDMSKIQNPQTPIKVVIRYTEDGFIKNQKAINPKTLVYAYLIQLGK